MCTSETTRRVGSAFTLVELIITISVIATLIGLLLPALAGASSQAKLTKYSIVQRQMFVALSQYTEDFDAAFPFFGTRGDPYGPVRIGDTVFTGLSYFMPPVSHWATALVPGYIESRSTIEHEKWRERNAEQGRPGLVTAQSALVACAFAEPAFFTAEVRERPLVYSQFRAMRSFEVVYPSDKVILTAWGAWGAWAYPEIGRDSGFPSTRGDGATAVEPEADALEWPTVEIPWYGQQPMHTTVNGLAGRDR